LIVQARALVLEEQLWQALNSSALQCRQSNEAAAAAADAACASAAAATAEDRRKAFASFEIELNRLRQSHGELLQLQLQGKQRESALQQHVLDVEQQLAAAAVLHSSCAADGFEPQSACPSAPCLCSAAVEQLPVRDWTEAAAAALHALQAAVSLPSVLPHPLPLLLSSFTYLVPSSSADVLLLLTLVMMMAVAVPRARQVQLIVWSAACCSCCLLLPSVVMQLLLRCSSLVPPLSLPEALEQSLVTVRQYDAAAAAAPAALVILVLLVLKLSLIIVKFIFRRLAPRAVLMLLALRAAVVHPIAPRIMSSSMQACLCLAFLILCPCLFPAAPSNHSRRIPFLLIVLPPAFALAPSIVIATVRVACAVCFLAAVRNLLGASLLNTAACAFLRRSVLSLACLFVLLHRGPAARHATFVPCAAAAASDVAAPMLLIVMAVTRPLAASLVICLRLWLVPDIPPLLLCAVLPSFVVSISISCLRVAAAWSRRGRAVAAVAAAATWVAWAGVQRSFELAAAGAGGIILDAGLLWHVVVVFGSSIQISSATGALLTPARSTLLRLLSAFSAPAAPFCALVVPVHERCNFCHAAVASRHRRCRRR
jgi:hypothetical protein